MDDDGDGPSTNRIEECGSLAQIDCPSSFYCDYYASILELQVTRSLKCVQLRIVMSRVVSGVACDTGEGVVN